MKKRGRGRRFWCQPRNRRGGRGREIERRAMCRRKKNSRRGNEKEDNERRMKEKKLKLNKSKMRGEEEKSRGNETPDSVGG